MACASSTLLVAQLSLPTHTKHHPKSFQQPCSRPEAVQKVSSFQLKNASAIRIGNLLSIPGSLDAPPKAVSSWHSLLECASSIRPTSPITALKKKWKWTTCSSSLRGTHVLLPPAKTALNKFLPLEKITNMTCRKQRAMPASFKSRKSSAMRRDTHLGSPRILATCFLLVKSFVSWEQHRTAWSWVKARAEIFKVYRERLICTPNVWVRTSRNLNQALKTGKLDVLEKHEKALELVSSHADLESSQRSNHLKVDLSNSLSQSYRTKGHLLGNPRHCKLCIRDGSFACDLIVP